MFFFSSLISIVISYIYEYANLMICISGYQENVLYLSITYIILRSTFLSFSFKHVYFIIVCTVHSI